MRQDEAVQAIADHIGPLPNNLVTDGQILQVAEQVVEAIESLGIAKFEKLTAEKVLLNTDFVFVSLVDGKDHIGRLKFEKVTGVLAHHGFDIVRRK